MALPLLTVLAVRLQSPVTSRILKVAVCDHIYFVTNGDGEFLGFEAECTGCRSSFPVNALLFPEFASSKKAPFSTVRSISAPWLDGESPEENARRKRVDRTSSALVRWNPPCEKLRSTPLDRETGIAAGVCLILVSLSIWIALTAAGGGRPVSPLLLLPFLAAVVSFFWMIKVYCGGRSRSIAKTILPKLIPQLKLEMADADSICEAFRRLKRARLAVARRLKPAVLLSALESGSASSAPPKSVPVFHQTGPVGAA